MPIPGKLKNLEITKLVKRLVLEQIELDQL